MPNVVRIPVAAGAFDPSDITLTDDTSGALLIKEGSNEYIRINTTNGSEQMVLKGNPGGAGTLQYAGLFLVTNPYLQGSDNNNVQLTTSGIVLQTGNAGNRCDVYAINSGNSFRVLGTGGAERFKVLDDSNATFTLDHGSGATFQVVDDNASPRTFIRITEGSSTRCLIPTLSFNEVKNASGARLAQLTTSNGIAIENTPLNHIGSGSLTYDQSHDGTAIDIGKTPSFTVVYSSAASAAATSGITLQVTATDFQDGCVAPQYLVLQNQNATHSAKFILDPIGDFAAKETATTGTDAADLIGSGFTLAAGKMAVFTLLACRVRDTGSHYFYCVSLHTKT